MNYKKVISGQKVFEKMLIGLNKVANAVGSTLGPKGRNAYLYDIDPLQTKNTNDGVTIANGIVLKDPEEDAGAFIIRNVSAQTLDDCGDGTTTTTVLTQAIIQECLKRPENPMEVRESLKQAGEKVLKMLTKKGTPIKKEDIEKVALISSEDKHLAKLITEIINKLGEKAVINVEDSKTFATDYEIVDGYEAHVGFMSPHFITDKKSNKAIYEDIPVLCVEKKISNIAELSVIFKAFQDQGITKCIIVAQEIDDSLLGMFVFNKVNAIFNSLVINATGPLLEDIAGATGATTIAEGTGVTFQNFTLDKLGKAKKVICDANKTIFIGDGITNRKYADELEAKADGEPNMYTQKTMRRRVAQLRGGVAVLRIGAPTDAERGYMKDKAEDAVKATLCAMEEGVVEGGGMTMWRLAQELNPKTIGETVLQKALQAPLRKICDNAGKDYTYVITHIKEKENELWEDNRSKEGRLGYDAKTDSYCELIKWGIIDPAKVERCALENAVSASAQFITTATLIVSETEEK